MDPSDVQAIVVHCSAGASSASVEDIRRLHVEGRGWSDIGYHWLIDANGVVHAGRDEARVGAHAIGFNHRSIAVCLIGHYDEGRDLLTDAMWEALVDLCTSLARRYGVDSQDIVGHRETYDRRGERRLKTCPGTAVNMARLRGAVEQRLNPPPLDVSWTLTESECVPRSESVPE